MQKIKVRRSSVDLSGQCSFLKCFLTVFIPSLVIVGVISVTLYFAAQHSRKKIIENQEIFRISQQEKIIRNDIKAIVADLMLLVNHYHLHSIINDNISIDFSAAAEEFLIFSRQKNIYDQVRFIDNTGMERIRINYNDSVPVIVPQEELQFKGNRYYFKDIVDLPNGKIYISPFDLNVEYGAIEKPRKPVIRFGAPVFNQKHEKAGIIVLNYLGREIFRDIKVLMKHSLGHLVLLNQDGYWLMGQSREDEWGFMYSDKGHVSFANRHPDAWENITSSDNGLFYHENGIYVFDTIYPLEKDFRSSTSPSEESDRREKSLLISNYYWKIVSHLDKKELHRQLHPYLPLYLLANGILAAFLAGGCWFIASSRLKHFKTEQDLIISERKFRTISDFSYDWDAWLLPDGSYFYISPSCERITGYPAQKFIDEPGFFYKILHPDDREIVSAHRVTHLDNSFEKAEVYFRIITKSGQIRWIWHQCQAVYSENDEWLGRRTTNRDVTEKHETETALQQERDMFLHGPVITLKWQNIAKWPVEQVSGNVFDIIGYRAEEIVDGSVLFSKCIHPEDLDRVVEEVTTNSNAEVDSFVHQPFRLISRSGEQVWVLQTTTIVRGDRGEISHYLGYLVDISEQKRQEHLVLESSKQKEELKRLQSLKTMAGAIAHRFNNAMMAVQGNLEIMIMSLPPDSEEHKMALDASQAARGASQVGSMMLSYVGKAPLKLQELPLDDLVRECIVAFKSNLPSTVTVRFVPPVQSLYCSIDKQQIKEVVQNILSNAFESLSDDTGTIEVTFGEEYFTADAFSMPFRNDNLNSGMYSYCQIKDSGCGIHLKDLTRIFDPFYTTKFVGRGLGLALTVGILQKHHGAVIVKSSPANGTSVRIVLPSSSPVNPLDASGNDHKSLAEEKFTGNVLLVDDEEIILDIGRKMLERMGFTVYQARNGLEAIDIIKNSGVNFSAVVLDVSMPEMDGVSAMNEIKRIRADLPTILSSGYSQDSLPMKRGSDSRPDGFLQKPFQLVELRACLKKLLM